MDTNAMATNLILPSEYMCSQLSCVRGRGGGGGRQGPWKRDTLVSSMLISRRNSSPPPPSLSSLPPSPLSLSLSLSLSTKRRKNPAPPSTYLRQCIMLKVHFQVDFMDSSYPSNQFVMCAKLIIALIVLRHVI